MSSPTESMLHRTQNVTLAVVAALMTQTSLADVPSVFELIGMPGTPVASSSLAPSPDIILVLSLNPVTLPPFPLEGTLLDLSDPTNPIYKYPAPQPNSSFEIKNFSFGVENPTTTGSSSKGAGAGKVTFSDFNINKTVDTATVHFLGDLTTPQGSMSMYNYTLVFSGLDPDTFTQSEGSSPILPCLTPCGFADFLFALPAPDADPAVSLTVTSGGSVLGFSEVPEPAPLALFGLGLVVLALSRRRLSH